MAFVDRPFLLLLPLVLAAAALVNASGSVKYQDVPYDFLTEADIPAFKHDGVQWEVYHAKEQEDRAYFFNTEQNYTQWEDPRDADASDSEADRHYQDSEDSEETAFEDAVETEDSADSYAEGSGEPPAAPTSLPLPDWVETWHIATACAAVVVTALFARSLFLGTPKRSKTPASKAAAMNGTHNGTTTANGAPHTEHDEEEAEEAATGKATARRSARSRA